MCRFLPGEEKKAPTIKNYGGNTERVPALHLNRFLFPLSPPSGAEGDASQFSSCSADCPRSERADWCRPATCITTPSPRLGGRYPQPRVLPRTVKTALGSSRKRFCANLATYDAKPCAGINRRSLTAPPVSFFGTVPRAAAGCVLEQNAGPRPDPGPPQNRRASHPQKI